MLNANQIYISEAAIASLNAAAVELHHRTGYSTADLEKALLLWFETALEGIAEDTLFHVLEGSSDLAIGRREFNRQLSKLEACLGTLPLMHCAS